MQSLTLRNNAFHHKNSDLEGHTEAPTSAAFVLYLSPQNFPKIEKISKWKSPFQNKNGIVLQKIKFQAWNQDIINPLWPKHLRHNR